jgi:hypothetical protein
MVRAVDGEVPIVFGVDVEPDPFARRLHSMGPTDVVRDVPSSAVDR